ncbi:MAG: hypothetical protein AB8G17_18965 [Gammaproteobacteria bacterium]
MQGFRFPASRWSAFGAHIVISVLIFSALFAVIYFFLFPGALFMLAGGIDGIKIIAGVDVVLGPLLTLVIYNVAKPRRELVRDVSIIGTIQIAALAAGMWVVYASRPVAVSYIYDTFHAIRTIEFENANAKLPAGVDALRPVYYYSEMPADPAQALQLVAQGEFQEFPVSTRSELMRPLPASVDELEQVFRFQSRAISQLRTRCVESEVVTAFGGGPVCFDPTTQRLHQR